MASSEPFMPVNFVANANSGTSTSAFSLDYTIVPVKDSFSVFITDVAVIWLGLKKWCPTWMMDSSLDSTNFLGVVLGSMFESSLQTSHLLQLQNELLEVLHFGSRRSHPIKSCVIKGVVANALIGHDQDKACSNTN
jgi:hypothetical protein